MKKNFKKVPAQILKRLTTLLGDDVVVACAKFLREDDLPRYAHLGLRITDGSLTVPAPAVPSASAGRYSRANVEGRVVVRYDLPKTTKSHSWYTPNWGDWSKGSHLHTQTREVYQRELIPPKELELSITVLERRHDGHLVKFAVDQVLSQRAADFTDDLLYNLNILQENVAAVDVFASDATLADFTASVRVDWEILPPGNVDDIVRRMLQGKRLVTDEQRQTMQGRLAVLAQLKPEAYIAGTNGFLRYFGAKFADDLVAFENLQYGNALYVMYEDWQELSRRSRVDLLKSRIDGFERIEHREGWEDRLKALLEARRRKR